MKIWLVGSGGMAIDYAKVLSGMGVDYEVIGRGDNSAATFEATVGCKVRRGGLMANLEAITDPEKSCAIVCVGSEALSLAAIQLLNHGFKRILVEKPAGLSLVELSELNARASESGASVFVAYNRRFYSSVRHLRKLINEDGGVTSLNYEFTEWAHQIEPLVKAPGVKERWLLGNSTHVIDLAIFLAGSPIEFECRRSGGFSWHPSGSVFVGSGLTNSGALFSYQANWAAPGRWGIELCTSRYRFILRPLETLQVIEKGSIAVQSIAVEDSDIDKKFKPGLFRQVEAFINDSSSEFLCPIEDQLANARFYCEIAGYGLK